MANLVQVRVDFRLVHGQVVTRWRQFYSLTKCIIVDDVLSKDEFLSQVYVSAAPPDMKVKVYSEDKTVRLWEKNQYGEGNVLLLLNNVAGCLRLAERGVKLPFVQLGGLPAAAGRRLVMTAVSLSEEEFEQLSRLQNEFGVEVYAQVTPEGQRMSFSEIAKKFQ